jgi:hypothetical protein
MLTSEFDARYAAAEAKFMTDAHTDAVKQIFTMDNCPCKNVQLLWMFALDSYDSTPGAVNILTERQLNGLFCRMNADGDVPAVPDEETPPVVTFTAEWAWMEADPYAALLVEDTIVYNGSGQFVPGNPIFADLRSAPANNYHVIRYPVTESSKTQWRNDDFNYGVLPDSNYRAVFIAHGYKYIVSLIALTLNPVEYTKFY